jgi:thiamine kinase-like enzyme
MKTTALKILNFFKENPSRFEKGLVSVFKNQKLIISDFKVLKEKLIIGSDYKITCLINFKKNIPSKIIFQIYDNKDYFQRNIFALKNLKTEKVIPPEIYMADEKLKIVYREFLEGDFMYDLIFRKKLNLDEINDFVKISSEFLSFLHNFKFKRVPQFLSKKLNKKIEKIILNRTLEFIKPNIEALRPILKRNLENLFKKMVYLEKVNRKCLIHGDYQPANFILSPKGKLRLLDFDTIEMGNPARDLGRFLVQLIHPMKSYDIKNQEIEKIENLFIDTYFKLNKIKFYPDFMTNLNTYKAEMIQYMILGRIWEDKVPDPEEIKKLLDYQSNLLNL